MLPPDSEEEPVDPRDDDPPQAAISADSEPAAARPPAPRASAALRVMRGPPCPSERLIDQLLLPYTQRVRQFLPLPNNSTHHPDVQALNTDHAQLVAYSTSAGTPDFNAAV